MKKLISLLLCVLLVFPFALAAAETAESTDVFTFTSTALAELKVQAEEIMTMHEYQAILAIFVEMEYVMQADGAGIEAELIDMLNNNSYMGRDGSVLKVMVTITDEDRTCYFICDMNTREVAVSYVPGSDAAAAEADFAAMCPDGYNLIDRTAVYQAYSYFQSMIGE